MSAELIKLLFCFFRFSLCLVFSLSTCSRATSPASAASGSVSGKPTTRLDVSVGKLGTSGSGSRTTVLGFSIMAIGGLQFFGQKPSPHTGHRGHLLADH